MTDLIKIDDSGKITARELYDFLSPSDKSHYSRWVKQNIEQNDFYQENVDWWGFAIMANGNETKDYSLTIDFAKHLCMLSRSERGKLARNYFIEVEKRYKSNVPAISSVEDLIILQATAMKELRQQVSMQAVTLQEQGDQIKEIAASIKTSPNEYYTVAGYASLQKLKIDVNKANLIGRKAVRLSKEYDVEIGKVSDPRFGQVNTYHLDVLKEAFSNI